MYQALYYLTNTTLNIILMHFELYYYTYSRIHSLR